MKKKFLVIIPAYNEENNIEEVVRISKKYADVCVINDGSTDKTLSILEKIDKIHIINHKFNTHLPITLIDGLKYAYEKNYDYAISIDAGLSHDPNELKKFIEFKKCDLLIGRRNNFKNKPFLRILLSIVGNFIYNILAKFPNNLLKNNFNDLTSGFRRYSKNSILLLINKKIYSKSYDIHLETFISIYRKNLEINEVDISYKYTKSSLNHKVVFDCITLSLKYFIKIIS